MEIINQALRQIQLAKLRSSKSRQGSKSYMMPVLRPCIPSSWGGPWLVPASGRLGHWKKRQRTELGRTPSSDKLLAKSTEPLDFLTLWDEILRKWEKSVCKVVWEFQILYINQFFLSSYSYRIIFNYLKSHLQLNFSELCPEKLKFWSHK